MTNDGSVISCSPNRRSFLKTGLATAGAVTMGTGLLARGTRASAQQTGSGSSLTSGDVAMLQFLAAGEALEADFYDQYNELGGLRDDEVSGGTGNRIYTEKLRRIDRNFSQYIHDIADDEMSHQAFLNAYLVSKGADPVDMEPFRTLHGSTARGSSGKLRLTNLMQLTINTSWWTRYRSSSNNPDVNPTAFEQAVPDLNNGSFPAIPRTDDDLYPHEHIQAIANTAAFHIPTVEQGGGSLRLALAQKATSVEVLRLLISMGPIELMHFQTLSETAGNAPPLIDPTNGLRFPDLDCGVDPNTGARGAAIREMFQTNLIMPEPCPFISTSLPVCSVVRPTNTTGVAMGALKFLTGMGLFTGQSDAFFTFLTNLAEAADAAQREV
ncbi:ferritin-like domain-containing protein [Acidicapsa acidisoli]|uniref:ferritin-like domain-containing protein n=1 Tax=Acidicapsa acidisoli TaxID=1615681 RepID=UPI0021E00BD0|nr:ferritin-like domain-containing protein [Acidicapsa acidisoli]